MRIEKLRESKIHPKRLFSIPSSSKNDLDEFEGNMEEPDFEAHEIKEVNVKFEGSVEEN